MSYYINNTMSIGPFAPDKLTEIANTAKGMSCMSPEAANSAIEGFINDADSAAEECEKCNA